MRNFSEQELIRREKIEKIREVCNPYPEKYDVNYEICDVKNLEDGTTDVKVAGRIVFMRKMVVRSFPGETGSGYAKFQDCLHSMGWRAPCRNDMCDGR